MIGKLTSYALRHRAIVFALLVIFTLAGISAFRRLPVEAYPDVTNVQVQIITLFPGHAAEEVERLVTIPVENEMNGIPKRASMRSISLFGLSVVTIVFQDDASGDYVRNQAFQHLSAVTLPSGALASLSPDATPVGEIYRYTLHCKDGSMPPVELKALEDWVVERKLRTVAGVVDVVGFGGPTKQYQVLIDPTKLKSYNISLKQVFDALSNGNKNAGGSYIEHGPEMYVVRGLGFVRDTQDIAAIAVDTRNGVPIRIKDVGSVTIGEQLRLGRVGKGMPKEDQDDVVQGIVLLRKGENALEVLQRIRAKADEINEHDLPAGVQLIPHYDRTDLINRTLHTVRKNMMEGIGLVLLVLILFLGLGNFRSALVVALVVPLSLLGAFLLLDLRGIPANLISMGAIDFGIIVDSAVVVIENLLRLLEEKKGKVRSLPDTIVEAVSQMGRPILFSKAILLTAFIPLYTLQRVEGKIFKPMALTLTFALIAGTILALTVVPMLASLAVKNKIAEHESWVVRGLLRIYRPILDWALGARYWVIGGAVACLVLAGLTLPFIGSEFLPKLDEGSLWVRGFMPETIAPTDASKLVQKVRTILASFPEVKTVVSQLGRPDDGTDVNGFDIVECAVDLKPRSEWTTAKTREDLAEAMNRKLSEIPGMQFQFSQMIEDNVNEAISGIKSELSVKIFGENPDQLQALANKIADVIRKVPGATDVGTDELLGQPQVQISIDRGAIARAGLSISDVQSVVETSLGGTVATQILEGERAFDLVVKLAPKAVSDLNAIRHIPVFGSNGERLTLGALTSVDVRPGFARIFREENARRIAVKLSVRGRDLGSLVAEAQKKVSEAVLMPKGYRMEWTGSFENQQRAVKRLEIIVPITLVAIFFLLFTAFDSSKLAILILLNVPFAAVGGILALPLAGLSLSVSALVGFIALFGVSVQNGVLLVERIRELRWEGRPMMDAVREGAISRVRPVVMTAAMAALGLLPAALSHAVGAETSRPFAVVIIGGLITATLLTLLLLPILYPLFETEKVKEGA
ncbi:efflux RND transporter permease subunit [Pedosphaera parvula]|uniref:Heavy metal efflux pump, CzcA family n=1 Tax=Pedosphaera parvula (strain Ellin514) TaxID=320771 RepID=B9XCF7_PEDPL|nr:CusA/CzcA family heavy metal efflux RND transporter [Pedosphaera parvula]EEF62625.1 heavy metal efflux pump, CzcA family [Pedosphaera parvula Ellin514]